MDDLTPNSHTPAERRPWLEPELTEVSVVDETGENPGTGVDALGGAS